MLTSCALEYLAGRGLVVISGFTPTDAAHVLGHDQEWSVEGARLGAEIWARKAGAFQSDLCLNARDLCLKIMEQMTLQIGRAVVAAALAEEHQPNPDGREALGRTLIDQALSGKDTDTLINVAFTLSRPLVAIGAPVHTYYPAVAERLHTRLVIPEHAAIANAVGAVAGSVVQTVRAYIKPFGSEGFRVHLPIGIRDFSSLQEALCYATGKSSSLADAYARRAGASVVQVLISRKDQIVDADGTQKGGFFLGSEVKATATGRPRLSNNKNEGKQYE
jgi:N-methylhydantoinase A/oxoprolinase/acetone carboxylase beta subunit